MKLPKLRWPWMWKSTHEAICKERSQSLHDIYGERFERRIEMMRKQHLNKVLKLRQELQKTEEALDLANQWVTDIDVRARKKIKELERQQQEQEK